MIAAQIKKNIKQELKQRNKSISDLCSTLGVNINYISQITDGTSIAKLQRIATAIGCSLTDILKDI